MTPETNIITPPDELLKLVKEGHFFTFCALFAVNKGYRDAIKEKKEVKFMVGDYEVEFKPDRMCFEIIHKVYFMRIIHAYYQEVHFIGDNEEEVINDLLTEVKKELSAL